MKETIQYFREGLDVAKIQWKSFTIVVGIMLGVYVCSLYILPGWVTYALSVPASLVVAITALARVNDIGPERMGRRWQVRKIGLILTGAGAVMMLATPFMEVSAFPTWRMVVIMWGFALAWLTTPDHPPWDYYITGKHRFLTHPPDHPRSPLRRAMDHIGRATAQNHSVEELMKAEEEYHANRERQTRMDGENRE